MAWQTSQRMPTLKTREDRPAGLGGCCDGDMAILFPHDELNGGAVYCNQEVPERTSRFNFTAAGTGFLVRMTSKHSLVTGCTTSRTAASVQAREVSTRTC